MQREAILAKFQCQNSGNCCRRPGYVYVDPPDVAAMAQILGEDVPAFRRMYVKRDEGWEVVSTPRFRVGCFLNGENKCDVYEARPHACRTYPDWPDIWKDDHALREEMTSCPGLKKAVHDVCGE